MKIGVISYPMLFQRSGGLQNQINETKSALSKKGVKIKFIDTLSDKLCDFDLVHIFSAINGNYRIVQEAKSQGISTILSPLQQPVIYNLDYIRFRLCSEITARLSKYQIKTSYDEIKSAIEGADHIITQSLLEKKTILKLYNKKLDTQIRVIPNGVSNEFFNSTSELFERHSSIKDKSPFVLVSGTISSYKNQLGVIAATVKEKWPIVLVGPIADKKYFERCLVLGEGRVSYLGEFDYKNPLLLSCYSAAAVTVLISQGETFGLTVVESLAAGTPAIITHNTGLAIPETPPLLVYVNPDDLNAVGDAIKKAIESKSIAQDCRNIVKHLSWRQVADDLLDIYLEAGCR